MQFNEIKKLFYCNSCFSIDNNIIPPLPQCLKNLEFDLSADSNVNFWRENSNIFALRL